MKNISRVLMAVSLVATTTFTTVAQAEEAKIQTVEQAQQDLENQKAQLEELQKSLTLAKWSRAGYMTATIGLGLVSVITAIPGVMMVVGGTKEVLNGRRFLGDPDNGGALMVPVVIVTSLGSAGAAAGAYATYQRIELKASDIKILLKKIEDRKNKIAETEEIIKTMGQ
jgi:hypothetical protein